MLVVSFFTPGYIDHATRLARSLRAAQLDYWLEPIATGDSWEHDCARKGRFVYGAVVASSRPVLWLDADAVVAPNDDDQLPHRVRELGFDLESDGSDFAIYRTGDDHRRTAFRSGTVWFNQTPAAHRLAEDWARRCDENPTAWDQESLFLAWSRMKNDGLRTCFLDKKWCTLFDEDGADKAWIVHHQASRQLKHAENR